MSKVIRGPSATATLWVAAAVCALTVLDTNLVGMILPALATDLGADFAQLEWIVSSYVLCFTALLLPAGTLADRYGHRRVLVAGLWVFALASLACGLAPDAVGLSWARAVQGAGAALLLAPALAAIRHRFTTPAAQRHAWGLWGMVMGLTMVASPWVGALLQHWGGWRSAFLVNVPVCSVLLMAVLRALPPAQRQRQAALDWRGMLLFSAAMLALVTALIEAPVHGVPVAGALLLVALLLGIIFIRVEHRHPAPMLMLSLFRSPRLVAAVLAMAAYAGCAQVMASLLPLYLQSAQRLSVLATAAMMLPFALCMLVFPLLGRRWDRGRLPGQGLARGLWWVAAGNLALAGVADASHPLWLVLPLALLGAGGGLLNGETQNAILSAVPAERAGMASGVSTTARFSGILLGFAGLGAVLAWTLNAVLPSYSCLAPEALAAADHLAALAGCAPAQWQAADLAARAAQAQGFQAVFLCAAVVAAMAALHVGRVMGSTEPALPGLGRR
ncbi:MFS transporter [Isoalcanivorax beigongshangi]|uniref:MFS transporter n=1 Tax=Isoalcanivorax beigongshangi TaxID=3238810 RepID=A0ABV4AFH6_9GAMM